MVSKKERKSKEQAAAEAKLGSATTLRRLDACEAQSRVGRRRQPSALSAGAFGVVVGGGAAAAVSYTVMYFLAPEPPGARAHRDAQVALTTLAALVEARPCGPTLAVLDLREIANANASLPSRLRCPVLFRGVAEWCGAAAAPIMRWDWKRLAASGPQALEYDESHEANFTYWDNSTLFAAAVRERGVRAQRHTRQLADSSAFAALALGGERWVRYGGSLRAFSQGLADELQAGGKTAAGALARVAPAAWRNGGGGGGDGDDGVALWAAAAGVSSSAHWDSFDNTHVLLAGRKHVLLAPPSAAAHVDAWPSTHPHARQGRVSLAALQAAREAGSLHGLAVREATLSPGEALFVPAGWLHEVRASAPSLALSLTALSPEFDDFTRWSSTQRADLLPFQRDRWGRQERWDAARLAAALGRFVPALLAELGVAHLALPSQLLAVYSAEARHEMGLPPQGEAWPHGCAAPRAQDAAPIAAAVVEVAARFGLYDAPLLPSYLLIYLENVLARLGTASGGRREKPTPASVIGAMLAFVETCLVGDGASASSE